MIVDWNQSKAQWFISGRRVLITLQMLHKVTIPTRAIMMTTMPEWQAIRILIPSTRAKQVSRNRINVWTKIDHIHSR